MMRLAWPTTRGSITGRAGESKHERSVHANVIVPGARTRRGEKRLANSSAFKPVVARGSLTFRSMGGTNGRVWADGGGDGMTMGYLPLYAVVTVRAGPGGARW